MPDFLQVLTQSYHLAQADKEQWVIVVRVPEPPPGRGHLYYYIGNRNTWDTIATNTQSGIKCWASTFVFDNGPQTYIARGVPFQVAEQRRLYNRCTAHSWGWLTFTNTRADGVVVSSSAIEYQLHQITNQGKPPLELRGARAGGEYVQLPTGWETDPLFYNKDRPKSVIAPIPAGFKAPTPSILSHIARRRSIPHPGDVSSPSTQSSTLTGASPALRAPPSSPSTDSSPEQAVAGPSQRRDPAPALEISDSSSEEPVAGPSRRRDPPLERTVSEPALSGPSPFSRVTTVPAMVNIQEVNRPLAGQQQAAVQVAPAPAAAAVDCPLMRTDPLHSIPVETTRDENFRLAVRLKTDIIRLGRAIQAHEEREARGVPSFRCFPKGFQVPCLKEYTDEEIQAINDINTDTAIRYSHVVVGASVRLRQEKLAQLQAHIEAWGPSQETKVHAANLAEKNAGDRQFDTSRIADASNPRTTDVLLRADPANGRDGPTVNMDLLNGYSTGERRGREPRSGERRQPQRDGPPPPRQTSVPVAPPQTNYARPPQGNWNGNRRPRGGQGPRRFNGQQGGHRGSRQQGGYRDNRQYDDRYDPGYDPRGPRYERR